MVYAFDTIAIGDQEQLKADKAFEQLHVMRMSGSIPVEYGSSPELLRLLGCLTSRQMTTHQQSSIEHCLQADVRLAVRYYMVVESPSLSMYVCPGLRCASQERAKS